jgi:hypothetical protein
MPHPSIHHIVRKKELHKRNIQRTKETFTICFESQSLSALLGMHMMIITSFKGDFSARGSIPVTWEYQPLLSRNLSSIRHQYEKVITQPHWRKMQLTTA